MTGIIFSKKLPVMAILAFQLEVPSRKLCLAAFLKLSWALGSTSKVSLIDTRVCCHDRRRVKVLEGIHDEKERVKMGVLRWG